MVWWGMVWMMACRSGGRKLVVGMGKGLNINSMYISSLRSMKVMVDRE